MASIPPGTDLSKVPLGPNPSGALPNFEHGASLIGAVQGVGISLAVVTTAFLVARLRVYVRLNRGLVLDDVFLLIAYVMALSYTIQASTLGRLCRHTWDTPLSVIDEDYLKKLFATSVVYGPMFFFAKAAILILYYRAFGTKTWMRWACWIMSVILFGAYWQTVPQTFMFCMPHNGRPWDSTILVDCNRLKIPGLVHGAMNVAADIIMVIMPLPIIIKLQIPLSKKIAVSAIFATGLLALICSALAVYYRVEISYGSDPVWSNAQAWIVIQAEIYAAICVACAPSLAKAWNQDVKTTRLYASIQSLLSSSNRTNQGSYPSNHVSKEASESSSALQNPPVENVKKLYSFSSIDALEEGYEMQDQQATTGVYRQVTVDVKSQPYNGSAV